MENSPPKNNLSFSFNLELDSVDAAESNVSSDSETNGLQIDVSEVESFNHTGRLRRQSIDDTSFLNEMEEEIERQLDAKAAKTNLTATNVKNILKHVISNEHVMAMVHKRLTKGEDDFTFEPKLTRAKAKELAMSQLDMPWPITPVKNTTSEVQILIQEEFPEDSSDEEYHPDQDQQSDDEKDIDNSVGSDIDSQPSTPATPNDLSVSIERSNTPDVQYDEEGIFKIPQRIPHVPTEEESIGHRTRSKLCLSETPLEQIEQAFIPPDITTDMYDWDWAPNDDYINFLKELYTQPLPKEVNIEDDPEADPEYNILEDEETDLLDKEELREDKAVKVSKKELKTLIAELDEYAYEYTKQQQQEQEQQQQQKSSKKKRTPESSFTSIGNASSPGNPMIDLIPVLSEPELPELINPHQRYLLSVQMSQHIQLMSQSFLMTYKHPTHHKISQTIKNNLHSLKTLSGKMNSEFIAQNLPHALNLTADWESKLDDPVFLEEYNNFLESEINKELDFYAKSRKYETKFHPELIKLMSESKALMHPPLLPKRFTTSLSYKDKQKEPYLPSEESLIAIGLEQFVPYVKSQPRRFNDMHHILTDALKEIHKYLLPIRDPMGMFYYVEKRKVIGKKKPNPISHYFDTGCAPEMKHCVLANYELLSPKEQKNDFLPPIWQNFVNNLQRDKLSKYLFFPKRKDVKRIDYNDELIPFDTIDIHINHELRNPIINMMQMPSLITPQKVESNNSTSKDNSTLKTKAMQSKSNETESDAESAESKTCETDEEESRSTRLRMTTPRLAKIRSAQNMKLMVQNLSPKASSSNSNINDNKEYDKNDDDESSFSKGDNEDEIAELMLASTTIKKNTSSRKKTKQARELENLKRLLEAENNINEDERSTKFAASFIQKIHVKLESEDPELFKVVLKIFLDYSEKLECPDETNKNKDDLSVNLYKDVCEKLHAYPDLCSDLLLFLTPHQAALVDKSVEHTMMLKMKEFINVTQMYFSKQPSRLAKVMQAITQMASTPHITVEEAQSIMGAALKGHPLVMDMFLQVLPTGKPPDSLFAAHMFENLSCPVGPHDKNKPYDTDAPELYENIELPMATPQEDPYGGDSCKCDCHSLVDDSKLKGINEHCASCGTRFLNGRIYLQTSEGLRPAKITFPGADDEKLENISRVSLKPTERIIPCPPVRKRRRSSKRDSLSEESGAKPCLSKDFKDSPSKDNEDSDKLSSKVKKRKSPSKSTDHKKTTKTQLSVKSKREKKPEKKDIKYKTDDDPSEHGASSDQTEFETPTRSTPNEDSAELDSYGSKHGEISTDSHEDESNTSPEKMNISSTSTEKLDISNNADSSTNSESETPTSDASWTMQEDKILLEHVQKDYSEKTFHTVSLILKNRSVAQVKERCEFFLSMIEKMT